MLSCTSQDRRKEATARPRCNEQPHHGSQARDLAERSVRSFYFVRTIYNDNESQMPYQIEQALISKGFFDYALHANQ